MSVLNTLKGKLMLVTALAVILVANLAYAIQIGTYEVSDFSAYNRDLVIGSAIDEGDVVNTGGFNALQLSGDNEYIKTVAGIPGFTNGSDWSWMAIVRSDQLANYRVFMRGWAWNDKTGDFDLRINPGGDSSGNDMYSWYRQGGWQQAYINSTALKNNETDLFWVAGTYDYSMQKYSLYVNGTKVGDLSGLAPMDDSNNTNPVNINGQWANGRVGNVYGEGNFTFAQLILSQGLYDQSDLLECFNDGDYMGADNNTWLDIRVKNTDPVPEPATMLLLGTGLIGLAQLRKNIVK